MKNKNTYIINGQKFIHPGVSDVQLLKGSCFFVFELGVENE